MNTCLKLWFDAPLLIGKVSGLLTVIVVCLSVSGFQCGFTGGSGGNSNPDAGGAGKGWRLWIKDDPCSGRGDWIAIAKTNPTSPGSAKYLLYNLVLPVNPSLNCTLPDPVGCTFEEANAAKEELLSKAEFNQVFRNYCCRDYSVWQNPQTGKMSIVVGTIGSPGPPWIEIQGNLCCFEAEEKAGLPGACSGSTGDHTTPGGGKSGYIGCFKDTSAFDLDGFLVRSQSNTPQRCVETCRAKGFKYAAVQYGESCLCGNSYGKYGSADNCNYPCTGDSGQICGGYNANSVYGTGDGGSGGKDKEGGRDACSCKNNCPDCAGLPSLLCVVEGESEKARSCRQCMSRCQNDENN